MVSISAIVMVLVPAAVGLAALFFGIRLLRTAHDGTGNSRDRTVLGVLCLCVMVLGCLVTLALGACVGLMSLTN